jgi:hypothetical protein
MTQISQKRFLQIELEKCQRKIKSEAVIIGGLKNTIEGHEEVAKLYKGIIAALSAQVAGGQIPVDGDITISRAELSEAIKRQAVSTRYDKGTDSFIIKLSVIPAEGGNTDDNSNSEGEACSEGNNDIISSEGSDVKLVHSEVETGSSEAPES